MISCADCRELLDAVQQTLPEGVRVVLLDDRGFDAVGLMAHCDRPGWKFRIRLKGSLNAFLRHLGSRCAACSPNAGERPSSSTTSISPTTRPDRIIWPWPNPRDSGRPG